MYFYRGNLEFLQVKTTFKCMNFKTFLQCFLSICNSGLFQVVWSKVKRYSKLCFSQSSRSIPITIFKLLFNIYSSFLILIPLHFHLCYDSFCLQNLLLNLNSQMLSGPQTGKQWDWIYSIKNVKLFDATLISFFLTLNFW